MSQIPSHVRMVSYTIILMLVYTLFSAVVPCLSEMTAVMSCWKVNSFDDVPCRKEIQDFVACAEKAVSRIQLKTWQLQVYYTLGILLRPHKSVFCFSSHGDCKMFARVDLDNYFDMTVSATSFGEQVQHGTVTTLCPLSS